MCNLFSPEDYLRHTLLISSNHQGFYRLRLLVQVMSQNVKPWFGQIIEFLCSGWFDKIILVIIVTKSTACQLGNVFNQSTILDIRQILPNCWYLMFHVMCVSVQVMFHFTKSPMFQLRGRFSDSAVKLKTTAFWGTYISELKL